MINTTIRTCVILFPLFVLSSCGSYKTPAAPSAVSLAGTVTAQDGARLAGATVRVVDGVNAGKSTTTNNRGWIPLRRPDGGHREHHSRR